MEHLPPYVHAAPKVFLAGESEGGMVAARYYHPKLEPLLERGGRIVLQWGCEWSYYVSCPQNALVGGGSNINLSTPILNLVSYKDPFFGPKNNSVAYKVANGQGGYGEKSVRGTCFPQLQAQGFEHGYVVQDTGSKYHGLTETTPNLIRAAFRTFMQSPRSNTFFTNPPWITCKDQRQEGGVYFAKCMETGSWRQRDGDIVSNCSHAKWKYVKHYSPPGELEACAA